MAFLEISDLHLNMHTFDGSAKVLNGIELSVERGEIWGLVGESGCGKSLTGLSVSRLIESPPGEYVRGSIRIAGEDVLQASERRMRALRGRHIGMIFQDPTTNLNPVFTVGEQMIDVALHVATTDETLLNLPASAPRHARRAAARSLAIRMLGMVGIVDAEARVDAYPHQFSGGMRQRVLIAMALIGKPELLIADEPTTALDVSVQAQILKLIFDLVNEHNLAALFITHNLGVVAQLCSHVAVMYAGNIVEAGPAEAVFARPSHPYTKALLAAVARAHMRRGELQALAGSVPDLFQPPPGCRLAPRCPHTRPDCIAGFPRMAEIAPGHRIACVLARTNHE
ncbi:ABC transporter ATP-binding protein [Caballeronia sp. NCF4]|uniref:ABC transporter ATP-binding protein n=1 Tax=Caballeronia sp. NCF4 TaxID=2921758 RepID=UPI00202993B3